jgi:hypothetical protein
MKGDIYIYGNLYTNHPMDDRQLVSSGVTIHVKEDAFFYVKEDDFELNENDVFIDDLFDRFDVENIIAFDNIK